MSEPTTPTGKRMLVSDNRHTGPCQTTEACFCGLSEHILAIEAEAREQERERLRALAESIIDKQIADSGEAMSLGGVLRHFTCSVVLADD